jgi:hypothetical protein
MLNARWKNGMLLTFLATVTLGCMGCSDIISELGNQEPKTGDYSTVDGLKYHLNTNGPAALTVTRKEADLCLLFWKEKEPKGDSNLVKLRGQSCDNDKFGALDWTAIYSYKRPGFFILYPPGTFIKSEVKPIEIKYSGG